MGAGAFEPPLLAVEANLEPNAVDSRHTRSQCHDKLTTLAELGTSSGRQDLAGECYLREIVVGISREATMPSVYECGSGYDRDKTLARLHFRRWCPRSDSNQHFREET